VPHRIIWSC